MQRLSRTMTQLVLLASAVVACHPRAARQASVVVATSELRVFAEGPCPKLSMDAIGERRFLVYGDTGYDLHAWMPGDAVAAAQAIAEVKGGHAYFNPAISAGLPTDARGYVHGALELGGDFETGAWLLRSSARYARSGAGALFSRETKGFLFSGIGWRRSAEPVALPALARKLPPLPRDVCPEMPNRELKLVPLAWDATPAGGVVVAGRCDDAGPTNYRETILMTLHGEPNGTSWRATRVSETETLDGIVNVDLDAAGDDDILLVAYEPFVERSERQSFVARYDGSAWKQLPWAIDEGLMSISRSGEATYLAGGRGLYRADPDGSVAQLALPPLVHTEVSPEQLHVHTVKTPTAGELWVEASLRVNVPAKGGKGETVWASALFSTEEPAGVIYCDAREAAEDAIYEVER